jgi:hypothetical protein
MNCTSYIDNVISSSAARGGGDNGKSTMSHLNDQLTHDLQDLDSTLAVLQDDFGRLVETAVVVDQSYRAVAHESDEIAAVTTLKHQANDAILSAATRFADLE